MSVVLQLTMQYIADHSHSLDVIHNSARTLFPTFELEMKNINKLIQFGDCIL